MIGSAVLCLFLWCNPNNKGTREKQKWRCNGPRGTVTVGTASGVLTSCLPDDIIPLSRPPPRDLRRSRPLHLDHEWLRLWPAAALQPVPVSQFLRVILGRIQPEYPPLSVATAAAAPTSTRSTGTTPSARNTPATKSSLGKRVLRMFLVH